MGAIYKNDIPYTGGGGGTVEGSTNFDVTSIPQGPTGANEINAVLSNKDNEYAGLSYVRQSDGALPNTVRMNVRSGLGEDSFELPTKELVDAKQDELVSGTNIKTVNGNSLLGEGNVEIAGGINFEVGVEKWYGTYTENGVTYQVYSKLLNIGALPSAAGATQYPHGITGIKQILQISGFTNDGFVMNAPRQNAQDNISIYQAQKAGNIVVEVGKDRSGKTGFAMMIYAKNN